MDVSIGRSAFARLDLIAHESADFRYAPVGINNRQVQTGMDDSFEIHACANDPGVANWICTQGYANRQTRSGPQSVLVLAQDLQDAA